MGSADGGDFVAMGDKRSGNLMPSVGGDFFLGVPAAGLDEDLVVGPIVDRRHEGPGGDLAFVPGVKESVSGFDFVDTA